MFVTSYSVTYCIYIPGKPGICFNYYCAVYDECKYWDAFWLGDHIRLFVQYTRIRIYIYIYICAHYHHCANLSEDIELIKCLSDIFCRVCDKAYSLSHPLYNMRGYVFSIYPFPL